MRIEVKFERILADINLNMCQRLLRDREDGKRRGTARELIMESSKLYSEAIRGDYALAK